MRQVNVAGAFSDAASAAQMLAMKARAARCTDTDDVRRLVELTGIGSVEGIQGLVVDAFGSPTLEDRQGRWIHAVLAATG